MSDTLNTRIAEFNRAIAEADLLRDPAPVKPGCMSPEAEAQQRRIVNAYLDMMEDLDDLEQ